MSTEIPRSLQVLWGAESRHPRGVQPVLSLSRIVAAAISIADRDGLAALSMSRLAQELGSAPMSLYRHVANKDELLVFMQDAAPGPPPELPPGWRAGLEVWGRALRGVYYAHPWILQVTAGRPPLEPGQLAWLDRGLSALDGTRLGVHQRYDTVMTVLNYVRGEAHIAAILLGGAHGATTADSATTANNATAAKDDTAASDEAAARAASAAEYAALVTRFVRPERFPALAAAIGDGFFEPDPADDGSRSFDYGLARILDGCQQFIDN